MICNTVIIVIISSSPLRMNNSYLGNLWDKSFLPGYVAISDGHFPMWIVTTNCATISIPNNFLNQFEARWWFKIYFFQFSPLFAEMIQFDEHIFQMGWFNHRLDQFEVMDSPKLPTQKSAKSPGLGSQVSSPFFFTTTEPFTVTFQDSPRFDRPEGPLLFSRVIHI